MVFKFGSIVKVISSPTGYDKTGFFLDSKATVVKVITHEYKDCFGLIDKLVEKEEPEYIVKITEPLSNHTIDVRFKASELELIQ